MNNDNAELIQSLIPFVTVEEILDEHNSIWLLPNSTLIAEYQYLKCTIPKMPLLPEMRGKLPVIRNLRDDAQYIQWELKNGKRFEVIEWEINRRNIYPSSFRRIEVK